MPTVRTNDVETYYERRGDGPPVVFVHGAILDAAQWTPQMNALEGEYTVVAYDVRGHGRTGGSARESYSVELLAADLRALVAALDLDRPVVCGLSMGGCIAQVYAAAHPDEVAGLVLADTFTPELFDRREWLQRSAMLRATVPFVRLVGYERVERAMVWLHERFSKGVSGDYGRIESLRAEGPKMETAEFAKVVRAVAAFHETTVDYSAVAAPTLVLYGEFEPSFVRRHAAKMAAEIPRVTVREVPGAGHASNLDDPDFFTDAVRAFLAVIDFGADGTETGTREGASGPE
ncbi:alpha/beta fold hydrolase [Halopelagius longus]|uniref:Alpha/beta hydrolase n=1 Tax=Halopelagius longus TaxID=1236180 RepID=A0A1H1BKL1_9EURY|nr:alpha/beta hydrolase [Halopelagius longus]RDI70823.1 alpha/beta hydrolase [Halopelagius longus]SDQ52478.1 Pimeloyl-ACP methyl ester carboxylesterase [Halopelagius longus]